MANLLWPLDEQWAVPKPYIPQHQPGAGRVATHYDKLAANFAAAVTPGTIVAFWCQLIPDFAKYVPITRIHGDVAATEIRGL